MFKKVALTLCIASLTLLAGCNKLTQDNYSKLKMGMERKEVERIFGKPLECQNALMATNCTWKESEASLYVQFADNKVITYFGNKIK